MKITFFIISIFIAQTTFSQTTFYKKYNNNCHFKSAYEYKRNNYLVCGSYYDKNWIPSIYKINSSGKITDTLLLDMYSSGGVSAIFPIDDSLFFVTGGADDSKIFIKIDTALNIHWQKSFKYQKDTSKLYVFSRAILDADSNIVYAGYKYYDNSPFGIPEVFTYKFNLEGDSINYKIYDYQFPSSNFLTFSNSIFQNPYTHNYYININNAADDSYIFRIKEQLELDTVLTYDNPDSWIPYMYEVDSHFTTDTTFVSTLTKNFGSQNPNIIVLLLDTNFNILNSTEIVNDTLDLHTSGSQLFTVFNNGLLYVLSSTMQLTCLDSTNLNILWSKQYRFAEANLVSHVISTSDSGLLLVVYDYFGRISSLIKTDSLGNVDYADKNNEIIFDKFSVYPNPADNYIEITASQTHSLNFVLFDINGRKILQKAITEKHTNISTLSLPEGIYFYKITTYNNTPVTGKIIIKH